MRLGGEVFQEQRIHRAFEADVKLADLALAKGDDLHAGEPQMLNSVATSAWSRLTRSRASASVLQRMGRGSRGFRVLKGYDGRPEDIFVPRRSCGFLGPRWTDQHFGGNAKALV